MSIYLLLIQRWFKPPHLASICYLFIKLRIQIEVMLNIESWPNLILHFHHGHTVAHSREIPCCFKTCFDYNDVLI